MKFHERVKAFRDEVLGMSQGELARKIGMTQSCLSNYENGYRDYTLGALLKISEQAGMTLYDFLKYTDDQHPEYKRLSYGEQAKLVREVQDHLLAGFIQQYEPFFANNSNVRDFISLLESMPQKERDQYIKEQSKFISQSRNKKRK